VSFNYKNSDLFDLVSFPAAMFVAGELPISFRFQKNPIFNYLYK